MSEANELRTISAKELKAILLEHQRWLVDNETGVRAELHGVDLRGADLRGADLIGASLSRANLSGAPKIENIHQTVYNAVIATPDKFDMSIWHGGEYKHACDTTHCRAGWVVALAGDAGRELEKRIGTPAAASLIYMASDPDIGQFPNFYCNNEAALADMKARAEAEAGQ